MSGKKEATRFNIQFNRENVMHLQAVEILHQQDSRGKARYIAEAILHFESCDDAQDKIRPVRIDEKMIEVVVKRMLLEMDVHYDNKSVSSVKNTAHTSQQIVNTNEEINFNDAMEAIGEDGLNAVTAALNMFRKK